MSTFAGYHNHMAGGFAMNRQFTAQTLAASLQDLLSNDWFGKADTLSADQLAAARLRGEAKRIQIVVVSGSVTSYLTAAGGAGDQKQTATTSAAAEWLMPNSLGLNSFYLDTNGAPATFEVWVEFDVPEVA